MIRTQREAFRSYLLQNPEVHYLFNGKEYHLRFVGCSLYPQGYPAIVNQLGNFKGTNLLADIGNGTMNILYINNKKAQESRCWTEKLGVNQCMIAAKNAVLDKFGVKIEESTIEQMNNNLDILDSQDISLKKQLEKDAAAFREEKFRPEPEQYTELLDTRIQIRPDFRDKLIEQLKGTFGKYYDYHRRDIAANEVDYLNVEDPDVFSHRTWKLKYQREQEMRQNQPVRSKKRSHDMEL